MIATIPVGILGLVFEHQFRVLFAKPVAAALFLMANGVILLAGRDVSASQQPAAAGWPCDAGRQSPALPSGAPVPAQTPPATCRRWARPCRRWARPLDGACTATPGAPVRPRVRDEAIVPMDAAAEHELARIGVGSSALIGGAQALALLAGVSREGVAMVGGLFRGLNNENALRFSFLLSTPVIFAAGILKVPDLTGPLGAGIRGPVLAGALAAAASSLFAVVFLSRYFKTRTLLPFAVYSLVFGLASAIRFGIF